MFQAWSSALLLLMGGIAVAGPFSHRHPINRIQCSGPSCQMIAPSIGVPEAISPPSTMQSPESRPEDRPVQQPWLPILAEEDLCSQPPDTVLVPVPGTGLKLPIGPKVPDKITHTLDPAAIAAIKEALKGTSFPKQPVSISLPVDESTSQRLSRILMLLEALAWLGGGIFGGSAVGRFLPLVARLANGLQSALPAPSPTQATTPAAPSSPPPKT